MSNTKYYILIAIILLCAAAPFIVFKMSGKKCKCNGNTTTDEIEDVIDEDE